MSLRTKEGDNSNDSEEAAAGSFITVSLFVVEVIKLEASQASNKSLKLSHGNISLPVQDK